MEIAKRVKQLLPVKDDAYSAIMDGLKNYGVEHLAVKDLSPEEDAYFRAFFTREIQPLLFTGVVDKKHPVPFLKSGEIYVGVAIRKKDDAARKVNVRDTSRVGEFFRSWCGSRERESSCLSRSLSAITLSRCSRISR